MSSYDDLMRQMESLKHENSSLLRELQGNSSHLTKLESEASNMKHVLSHLHTSIREDLETTIHSDLDTNLDNDLSYQNESLIHAGDSLDQNSNNSDESNSDQNWLVLQSPSQNLYLPDSPNGNQGVQASNPEEEGQGQGKERRGSGDENTETDEVVVAVGVGTKSQSNSPSGSPSKKRSAGSAAEREVYSFIQELDQERC